MKWAEFQESLRERAPSPARARRSPLPGTELRRTLITAGVLREEGGAPQLAAPPADVPIDHVGIVSASREIFSTSRSTLGSIVAQAEPRVAACLRFLASHHGVPLVEAA